MLKSTFTLLLTLFLIISCQNEKDTLLNYDDIEIENTQIINNNEYGVTVKTTLIPIANIEEYEIVEHGFIWTLNGTIKGEVNLRILTSNSFETTINTELVKNNIYEVYPYIKHVKGIVYGTKIEFKSLVEIAISISEITPLNGFVGDTIFIKGSNFCRSIDGINGLNQFNLGNSSNRILYESDTLIKTVVGRTLDNSKPNISIRTCGVVLNYDVPFSIDPPVIDSISSGEFYPRDNMKIYGKNFLSQVSKVWIGGIEVNKSYSNNTNELSVDIPRKLPTGKLDVKIQVLDQIVEAKGIYQSTTPYIEIFTPTETGFLDTITIQGKFLYQKGLAPEVKVGYTEEPYFIENDNKNELKVVLSNSFSGTDPMLSVKAGEFTVRIPLNMLPPTIVSLDKKKYHLNDDIEIVSKNYINKQWFTIGYNKSGIHTAYEYNNGIIKINMGKYFGETSYAEYTIIDGKIDVRLSHFYGESIKKFSVYPPVIESIDKEAYYKGDYIEIKGNDFGAKPSSKVYIDNIAVGYKHSTSHLVGNQIAKVQIAGLDSGTHKVKVVTGGQESNEVEFVIKEVKTSSLSPKEGHRETLFTIEGENLGNSYLAYYIQANGFDCAIVRESITDNKVQFHLPSKVSLEGDVEITIVHENETIKVGTVKAINEPYKYVEEYNGKNYRYDSGDLKYFNYDDTTYFISRYGKSLQKFNFDTMNWESVPNSNIPSDFCFTCLKETREIITLDDVAYIYKNSTSFFTYNFKTSTWGTKSINLENGESLTASYGKANEHTLIIGLSSGMYNYNINTGKRGRKLANPPSLSIYDYHFKEDKMVLSSRGSEMYIYDIPSDTWKDISFDYPASRGGQNIYIHNNILYKSGGANTIGNVNYLYAYDIKQGTWKRKLPSIDAHLFHIVFGHGDKLYFVFGNSYWNHELLRLLSYDIKKDPF